MDRKKQVWYTEYVGQPAGCPVFILLPDSGILSRQGNGYYSLTEFPPNWSR